MAIYAVRKGNETNERLMQRFKKYAQQSGIQQRTRNARFFKSPYTKREQRLRALHREKMRAMKRKQQFYSNM
jgi:ribosomal protein S21